MLDNFWTLHLHMKTMKHVKLDEAWRCTCRAGSERLHRKERMSAGHHRSIDVQAQEKIIYKWQGQVSKSGTFLHLYI